MKIHIEGKNCFKKNQNQKGFLKPTVTFVLALFIHFSRE